MNRVLTRAANRRRGRLHVLPPPRREPVPGVVELARQVGAWAEEGSAVALGVVVVHDDGSIGTAFYHGNHWSEVLAGASCLRRRLEDAE